MCPEALVEHIENISKIYRSENFPGVCIRSAYAIDDMRLVSLFEEKIPCDFFNLQLQREPSYLAVSQLQYNRSETKVIVLEKYPDEIIAMLNIGWKYCFINEKPDLIRYISDLKIHPKFRHKNLMRFLMQYLSETLDGDSVVQSVVLNQYPILQTVLYQPKRDFPRAFLYDEVDIYTVSYVAKPKNFHRFHYKVLTAQQIPALNAFVESLRSEYNFLPNYDFKQLIEQLNPYWRGMQLSDFYLVYNQAKQIIGVYGLWDQSAFKQVHICGYNSYYPIYRPIYNAYASIRQYLRLPAAGQALDHLMLHSALCKPEYSEVFACILYHAQRHTRLRKKSAFCVALAQNDPRQKALKSVRYLKLQAQHSLHSFQSNPSVLFDRKKISYFELGRL